MEPLIDSMLDDIIAAQAFEGIGHGYVQNGEHVNGWYVEVYVGRQNDLLLFAASTLTEAVSRAHAAVKAHG